MMRSESTNAFGQPSETNEIFGVGAFMPFFASERSLAGLGGAPTGSKRISTAKAGRPGVLPSMALCGHKWQKPVMAQP